jgi:iron complex transport system ATP-binding protein
VLAAADLIVRVDGATLLDGVSVDVLPGQVLAVVGPNGAGKSTLLRALAGDIQPSGGAIALAGRPLADWRPLDAARVRAVLLQHGAIDFDFTAFEVALLGRAPHAGDVQRTRNLAIAGAALAAADAGHLRVRRYPTLSGGERQRVQLARALAQIWDVGAATPRYLLLDEPTAALDLSHQHRMLQRLREWAGRGAAVLVVLHDLNLAAAYADRVMVLHGGRAVACGSPDEALTAAVIESVFDIRVTLVHVPEIGRRLFVPHPPAASPAAHDSAAG